MSKKKLIAISLSVILAIPMFASDTQQVKQSVRVHQHCKMAKEDHMYKDGLLSDLKQLKLSDDQRKQVRSIVKEHMQTIPNPNDAFTDNSFDKAMYIKLEQQKRDNMIENRADMIEKVYNILTDTQKKEFKVMFDKHKSCWIEKK